MNIILELQEFDDLIIKYTSPPTTSMLRGKLHPIQQAITSKLDEQAKTEAKLSQSERECANLAAQLKVKEAQKATEFVLNMGVFWKRTLKGFEPNPYCPKCRQVMIRNPPYTELYWECGSCHAEFPGDAEPPPK